MLQEEEKCVLKAETLQLVLAKGREIKGGGCSEKCWFLEEPVRLSSAAAEAVVLRCSLTSLAQVKISHGTVFAHSLLKSVFCNHLVLFICLSSENSTRCVDRLKS